MQLRATEQNGELTECKEQLTQAVTEVQKVENRLEVIMLSEKIPLHRDALFSSPSTHENG
jgi:hypothetical protein